MEKILNNQKEVASELGRSRHFVRDMQDGGFRIPTTISRAFAWLRLKGHPRKFRKKAKAKKK